MSHDTEFIVDITKPPIAPPNRTMTDLCCETAESARRQADYRNYLHRYAATLKGRTKEPGPRAQSDMAETWTFSETRRKGSREIAPGYMSMLLGMIGCVNKTPFLKWPSGHCVFWGCRLRGLPNGYELTYDFMGLSEKYVDSLKALCGGRLPYIEADFSLLEIDCPATAEEARRD